MAPTYASLHQQTIEAIVAHAPRGSDLAFIRQFYAQTTVDHLRHLPLERAVEIALASNHFHQHRPLHGPSIAIQALKVTEGARSYARTQVMVINDDMPFLVDSLTSLFTSLGFTIHLLFHPILATARTAKGQRQDQGKSSAESLIYAELSPLPTTLSSDALVARMQEVLTAVATSVADWTAMRDRVHGAAEAFSGTVNGVSAEAVAETRDMLLWLASNHFVFLGLADFVASGDGLTINPETALGLYRLPERAALGGIEHAPQATTQATLGVLKASAFSPVHRHVPLDLIVVRHFNKAGETVGELRFLGLFTSTVYYRETQHIPFIRRKAEHVLARAGFTASGHSGKTLKTTLEFLPRDELFQMDDDTLFHTAMGIVALEEKPQVRLFVRGDDFERFVSAMVYIPRERFSTDLRGEVIRLLERAYAGRCSSFTTQITDSPLARLHALIETTPGAVPQVDTPLLEHEIIQRTNNWADALQDAVIAEFGEESGLGLVASFADAFPPAYRNTTPTVAAAHDIRRTVECVGSTDGLALELFRSPGDADNRLHLKCFSLDMQSELSTIIPSLEHMGASVVEVTPHILTPRLPMPPVLLRHFTLRINGVEALDLAQHKARIEAAIAAIWRDHTADDTLNTLVFAAGLTVREVEILRAYSRYLQQLDFPYSQPFIAGALMNHAVLARALTAFFAARFDPAFTPKKRETLVFALQTEIEAGLETITNLAEDRIIRQFFALMQATLRTNAYQLVAGKNSSSLTTYKPYLSLKFDSARVPEMKLPIPYREIFVTGQRMEGIHLRGGAVARGGLRWSDRPEDFRTEVLGLMKTQMVKNAVIVPQGAKGGFILRHPPTERDALQAESIACYQMFLRGLLDITDNIVSNAVVPPTDVVRHDGDDPYLVVAADKGTATFSDIANGISAEYGFWLGDAFASGGSVGYDHKAMAITARGGWVAVERHFREMGKDITQEAFTAIGIGDMSGDVFGNGALLSRNMRLVAAFNHRHIFVDPNPDAARTYTERARLFALPRSGWNDYDSTLISKGGGVFERSAKSIPLTAEMRALLGTEAAKATPDELIRIILKAPVELLWNGGIGTYVKAASETHEQVGDRANNPVRVDGRDLRARIVGEGGNLGFTQRGRIEYARLAGGRINTDAIDNSGGVDCSDHEVNIKIALGAAMDAKRLSLPKRDALLKTMTEEVANLVLIDNQLQTQAISIAHMQGFRLLESAAQLMETLEAETFLNRAVEFLPDAKELSELRNNGQGLTRPEIAVLLAYAKMAFFRDIVDSPLLDDPYFENDLLRYFPIAMHQEMHGEITRHRLRREIVATMVTNSIVNRTGFSFAHRLMKDTGLPAIAVAQAYVATRDAFGLRAVWAEIEALRGTRSAALQSQLFATLNRFITHSCRWLLTHSTQPLAMSDMVSAYAPGIAELMQQADSMMHGSLQQRFDAVRDGWLEQGVPPALALRMAQGELLYSACDIIDIARESGASFTETAQVYFTLGDTVSLAWLREAAHGLPAESYWQQLAVTSLVSALYQAQRGLSLGVIRRYRHAMPDAAHAWAADATDMLARHTRFMGELRGQATLDYPMLMVALQQVQSITV